MVIRINDPYGVRMGSQGGLRWYRAEIRSTRSEKSFSVE